MYYICGKMYLYKKHTNEITGFEKVYLKDEGEDACILFRWSWLLAVEDVKKEGIHFDTEQEAKDYIDKVFDKINVGGNIKDTIEIVKL